MSADKHAPAGAPNLLDHIPGAPPTAAAGDARDPAPLLALTEPCDEHGPWHPYALNGAGQLVSAGNMCPACRREAQARRLYGAMSGVPARYASASFDNFERHSPELLTPVRRLRAYAQELASGSAKNLLLMGAVGTGKTHLGIAICSAVAARGHSVVYSNILDLLDRLRQDRFPQPPAVPGQFADSIAAAELLVIDECGKQIGTESEAVAAQRIVDRRYANNLPTIVISNGGVDDVRELITSAAVDRLLADCLEVTLTGRSYREIQRQRNANG